MLKQLLKKSFLQCFHYYYFSLASSIYYITDTLTVELLFDHKWRELAENQLTLSTWGEICVKFCKLFATFIIISVTSQNLENSND